MTAVGCRVVELPHSARIVWARGNAVIVTETDEMDTLWLARYSILGAAP